MASIKWVQSPMASVPLASIRRSSLRPVATAVSCRPRANLRGACETRWRWRLIREGEDDKGFVRSFVRLRVSCQAQGRTSELSTERGSPFPGRTDVAINYGILSPPPPPPPPPPSSPNESLPRMAPIFLPILLLLFQTNDHRRHFPPPIFHLPPHRKNRNGE